MKKYYFKTRGQEPDIECAEKCYSQHKSNEGVMIGSVTCQKCKCCKESDIDEWGDITWIKCSDLFNALKTNEKVENNCNDTHKLQLGKSWDSGWRWGLFVGSLITGIPTLLTLWYLGVFKCL